MLSDAMDYQFFEFFFVRILLIRRMIILLKHEAPLEEGDAVKQVNLQHVFGEHSYFDVYWDCRNKI